MIYGVRHPVRSVILHQLRAARQRHLATARRLWSTGGMPGEAVAHWEAGEVLAFAEELVGWDGDGPLPRWPFGGSSRGA